MKHRPAKIFCLFVFLAMANSARLCAQTGTNAIAAEATNAAVKVSLPAATNTTLVAPPPKPRPATLIEADGPADFDLSRHRVIYHDHVRVDDPAMKLHVRKTDRRFACLRRAHDQHRRRDERGD